MILPVELLSHIIHFYISISVNSNETESNPPRSSISPLTLSSTLLRFLALKTFYTSLSYPLTLRSTSDWFTLLSHSSSPPYHIPLTNLVRSLVLTHQSIFLSLVSSLPNITSLTVPLIVGSPHSAPLLERITWIPTNIKELNISVERKVCGVGAVLDMIGGRFDNLERLGIRYENEKMGLNEEVFREIAVQITSSSLSILTHLNTLSLELPLFTLATSEDSMALKDTLQTLSNTHFFTPAYSSHLRSVNWITKERTHTTHRDTVLDPDSE